MLVDDPSRKTIDVVEERKFTTFGLNIRGLREKRCCMISAHK